MVVFEDGLARKSEYRRFVVRSLEGQNDVGAMHEVITRRFRRLLDERVEPPAAGSTSGPVAAGPEDDSGRPLLVDPDTGRTRKFAYAPGLVVVDGGPPQVAAAQRALDELGIHDIPVCGLAKRLEEIWLPGQEDPVIMPRTSEALFLLQRVRDEAHRFAITHHRSRRSTPWWRASSTTCPGWGRSVAPRCSSGSAPCARCARRGSRRSRPFLASGRAPRRRSWQPWRTQGSSGGRQVSINTATGEIEEG